MKKLLTLLVALSLATPSFAHALQFDWGAEYSLPRSTELRGNLYALAQSVDIRGNVIGDIFGAARDLIFDGRTPADVLLFAGTVDYSGIAEGDVRIAGGDVSINNTMGGDLLALAGRLTLSPSAVVTQDAIIFAGQATIRGEIKNKLYLYADTAVISGKIGKDTFINASKITLEPGAVIAGNLTYRADRELKVPEGALIQGVITRESVVNPNASKSRSVLLLLTGLAILLSVSKFLIGLITAIALNSLFGRESQRVVLHALGRPLKCFLIGFAAIVAMPVAFIVLTLSVIGIPLGVITFFAYGLFFMAALLYAPIPLGAFFFQKIRKLPEPVIDWKTITVGYALAFAITLIPFFGTSLWFILIAVSFGALLTRTYERALMNRV